MTCDQYDPHKPHRSLPRSVKQDKSAVSPRREWHGSHTRLCHQKLGPRSIRQTFDLYDSLVVDLSRYGLKVLAPSMKMSCGRQDGLQSQMRPLFDQSSCGVTHPRSGRDHSQRLQQMHRVGVDIGGCDKRKGSAARQLHRAFRRSS
jgi:hypothetical protein